MKSEQFKGYAEATFDHPLEPYEIFVTHITPYNAKVTRVKIEYVTDGYYAMKQKRHDAAVKANATRKAKKNGGAN